MTEWNVLKDEFEMYSSDAMDYLNNEFFKIRTGRITPSIFDGIKVEAYGALAPINQVANIQILDAKTTLIKPFDKSILKEIVSALNKSTLGVTASLDTDFVKINFPPITEETRIRNVKKCKELLEQAKLKVRKGREEVKSMIKKAEDSVGEDTIFQFNQDLDKLTKSANTKLEEMFSKKEQELLKV
ncbi:MAG: ribosome recycling factor [Mycoplasmoidaceae bacterium]|nr:MAG: ribosome recycling factor [Mycoplasmoidaceae bacterium]